MGFIKDAGKKIGGSFAPVVETKEVKSQATPIANDFVNRLRAQGDSMTEGVNSLQRESGTAIRQFMNGNSAYDFGPDFKNNPFTNLKLDLQGVDTKFDLSGVREPGAPSAIRGVDTTRNPGITSIPDSFGNIRSFGTDPTPIRDIDMTRTNFGSVDTSSTGFRDIPQLAMALRNINMNGTGFSNIPTNAPNVRDVNSRVGNVRDVSYGANVADIPMQLGGVRDIQTDLGPQQFNLSNMVESLTQMMNNKVGAQVGDLREAMGIAGTRFGSSLATGEARLRAEALPALAAQIGQVMAQADESRRADAALKLQGDQAGVQRDLGINEVLMQLFGLKTNRDIATEGINTERMGLGINRDIAQIGAETERMGLGVQRDLGLADAVSKLLGLRLNKEQAQSQESLQLQDLALRRDESMADQMVRLLGLGTQQDAARSNENVALRGLDLQKLMASSEEGRALQALKLNRDQAVSSDRLGIGDLALRGDVAANSANQGAAALKLQQQVQLEEALQSLLGLGVNRDTAQGQQSLTASGQGIQRDLGVQGNELQKALSLADLMNNMKQAEANFGLNTATASANNTNTRAGLMADADSQNKMRMLQAIAQMSDIGNSQIQSILPIILAGINPENTVVKDGTGKAMADSLGGILQGIGSII